MTIGDRIREKRKEMKISADELGKLLGKNRATIYRYEKGDIENLPLDILEPIANALDTTPAYLMGWEEEVKKKNNLSVEVVLRMESDPEFFDLVETLCKLDAEKIRSINKMLKNFL